MDIRSLKVYDQESSAFAKDWHDLPAPVDLQALVLQCFLPGQTADIGCGSGRDTAWLSANEFPTIGFDPSEGLLAEARRLHPESLFQVSALPETIQRIMARKQKPFLSRTAVLGSQPN